MAKLYTINHKFIKITYPKLYEIFTPKLKRDSETGYQFFMRVRNEIKNPQA